MRPAGCPDAFVVLNGPQDGTEFPIGSPSVHIGRDHGCTVNVQLDQSVQPLHAVATAVGNGYTIRASTPQPIFVDGKKVTRLRSRVLHPGQIMRVGYTDLILECSPDGMSGRSKGIALQTDFVWAIKSFFQSLAHVFQSFLRGLQNLLRWAWRHKIVTIVAVFLLARYVPAVDHVLDRLIQEVRAIISDLTG